jgi:hypothetical protein
VITSDRASLAIYSETHPAAHVTGVLGLQPSRSYERGDRFGRGLVRAGSGWFLDAPPADADATEDSRLDVLVRMLRGASPALARLRENYDTEIGYTGFADSEHGSFAFSAGTIAQLAELGCGLTGSVHLEEPDPDSQPDVRGRLRLGAADHRRFARLPRPPARARRRAAGRVPAARALGLPRGPPERIPRLAGLRRVAGAAAPLL